MKKYNLDSDIKLFTIALPNNDWQVKYHQFYQVYPQQPIWVAECPQGDYWELFKATLLVLENSRTAQVIDIGWLPEADPAGVFNLQLLDNYNYDQPLKTYTSTDAEQVLSTALSWITPR